MPSSPCSRPAQNAAARRPVRPRAGAPVLACLTLTAALLAACGGGGGGGDTPTQPPPQQTLTVAAAGTGSGTVSSSPAGIACTVAAGSTSGTCSASFAGGTSVTLTATPAAGHTFAEWGGACAGASCALTMSQARAVTATFTPAPVASVTVTPAVSALDVGQTVTLTAAPVAADNTALTGRAVTWATSNAASATVSGAGVVTAVAPADTVRITATVEGKTATAAVLVRAPVVTVAATDASASEAGSDAGAFTLSRTGPTTAALAVSVTLGGTATGGADYAAVVSPVAIPAGQASVVVPVTPRGDAAVEGDETVVLTVADGAGYAVGTPNAATVTIQDAVAPPGALVNGFTHVGRIAAAGQADRWTFTTGENEYAVVSVGEMGSSSSTFQPSVSVVAPNGTVLASSNGASVAQVDVSIRAAGTYTVVVSSADPGATGTGDYRLTLAKSAGPITVADGDESGALSNGATQAGRLFVGDVDVWTVVAGANDYFVVSVGETGTPTADFRPWLRLIRPNGQVAISDAGDGAAGVAELTFGAGTYTVVVGTSDGLTSANAGAGDYRITLVRVSGDLAQSPGDEGGPMTQGTTHTGHIYVGDVDAWTFDATPGEDVVVSVGEAGTPSADFRPWVQLIGPGIRGVSASANGVGAARVDGSPNVAGRWLVVVGSADGTATNDGAGDYRLTFLRGAGARTLSPGDEGQGMARDSTYAGALFLGDVDAWTFTGVPGQLATIRVAKSASATFRPDILVSGPTGRGIAGNQADSVVELSLVPTAAGTYTVTIGAAGTSYDGHEGVGGYTISVSGAGAALASPRSARHPSSAAAAGLTLDIARPAVSGAARGAP